MCGIAGYSTIGAEAGVDSRYIQPMLDLLIHRGPDDEGSAAYKKVVIGNRRLAVIDLKGGHQPITNEDGSVVVVCNGEIYNFAELKKDLIAKGHVFSTATDTEVLVHLYEEEGIGFLRRLNGMFALALYDRQREKLILAVDRFGVKPLVYSYHEGRLAFSSEIKALRVLPGFDSTLDHEAMGVFLGLSYIPAPWTIYKNVRKLHAGHCLVLSQRGLEEQEYYDLDYSRKDKLTSGEAEEELAYLFKQAVRRQMVSDVPVGVLLSGGLDSRSILAAASEVAPGLSSFTITFDEAEFNEGGPAEAWARLFQSPHHGIPVEEEDFFGGLLAWQKHADEPFAPWDCVARVQLARAIRSHGHKVVLGGDGGDELFLGYPTVQAANFARYYRRFVPKSVRNHVIRPLVDLLPSGNGPLPLTFKMKSFVAADHPDLFRNFFGFKEVVRYSEWAKMLSPEAMDMLRDYDPAVAYSQYYSRLEGLHFVDALSYLDFKTFLAGSIFKAGDNTSMAASVEMRVPFMDNDLVDFACRLPVSVRFHPFKLKVLLHRALQKHFEAPVGSKALLKSYRKAGFWTPHSKWLRNGRVGGELLKKILSRHRLETTGIFKPETVEQIMDEQLQGKRRHERILQTVVSLVLFLDNAYGI